MKNILLLSILFTSCQIAVNDYEYVVKNKDFRDAVLNKSNGEYVELSDGYTYFEEANQDSNLGNVVLVHGYSIPSYIMETTFNSLKQRGYRVIMMDLYGRGFSDNPDLPQTDYLRANQVIELMKYRGIENAALVGLSNGGRIISKIADLNPNKVNSFFTLHLLDFLNMLSYQTNLFLKRRLINLLKVILGYLKVRRMTFLIQINFLIGQKNMMSY